MAQHTTQNIRNLALAGHGASGKTSLADALLWQAKAVERRGSVEDGTSVSDYDEEEHRRKFSIDTSVLHLSHNGTRLNLLDTPGYPDFVGAALEALNAVENAVLVVSAVNGLEVNSRRMAREAERRGLARIIVVSKLDQDNVHFPELLTTLRETFGKGCVLFNAPVGVGPAFKSVVSVLADGKAPAGCPVDLAAERSRFVDAVVEADEALMEKYLDQGDVSADEVLSALPRALAAGTVIPIFCTSSKKSIGIAELLDTLASFTLSPEFGQPRKVSKKQGGETVTVELKPDPSAEFVGQVFKTVTDKFVGNMSFLRIYQGTYSAEQQLVNARTDRGARTGGLFEVQGARTTPIPSAIPGDIVAITKVEELHIGDTVSNHPHPPALPDYTFPRPMFGLAVQPKARGDETKISASLAKIANEDATFRVSRDPQTHEMVVTGMSQLHLDVVQHRLKRRFDLEVVTHEPKVAYRETITRSHEGQYRHKKQTGGRGQFGEVHLRIHSMPREITTETEFLEKFATKDRFEKLRLAHYDPEHNFAFLDTIVGGTIPNQFVPAVEKGCKELLEQGALAGYRMQDIAVEVYEGKYHPVDSSEAAFKIAGRLAFKAAFLQAHPVILEPFVHLEVTVPTKYTGDVLRDLNGKRARVENQDSLPGDLAVITARAPLAEVMRYAAQLGSITQGQGSYSMEFSHYDTVPANVQQQIVSKATLKADEDE
jgi:elongation factor G